MGTSTPDIDDTVYDAGSGACQPNCLGSDDTWPSWQRTTGQRNHGRILSTASRCRIADHGSNDDFRKGQRLERIAGIYTDQMTDSWKQVVAAVHGRGGKIFMQLWHCGRAAHSSFLGGELPVAPSAIAINGDGVHTPRRETAP